MPGLEEYYLHGVGAVVTQKMVQDVLQFRGGGDGRG